MANMLLGGVADRLVPILQTPVEDIIYEVLDQKGFPTRQEVRELRNKLDRLEKSVESLTQALDGLQSEIEKAGAAAEAALDKARAAEARPSGIPAQAAPAAAPTSQAARQEAAAPLAARAGVKVCKVEDCGNSVRARGFCARHYQQWKRSTLLGFVYQDGTTVHEAVRYAVDEEAGGEVVEVRYEGDEVIFLLPESERTIRARVDDVRRYDD